MYQIFIFIGLFCFGLYLLHKDLNNKNKVNNNKEKNR